MHKNIRFSLLQKLYLAFFLFIAFGWYKNALVPYLNGYYSFSHLFYILLYPLSGLAIGALFDTLFKNKMPYDNKFYGLLFSLIVPISTNIFLFLLILTLLLFLNTLWISKKDLDLHFIVLGKLLLVAFLWGIGKYYYANLLEESHLFVYSYLDHLFGHIESGLFTSSAILILGSFLLLVFDPYYKKEIPFYGYGVYLLTLVLFSIYKGNMNFLLAHMFSPDVLFLLVILAPLSNFSPYSKKRIAIYSIFVGFLILPFSLLTNFYEGAYFSLILANLLLICLNSLQIKQILRQIH